MNIIQGSPALFSQMLHGSVVPTSDCALNMRVAYTIILVNIHV